MAVIKKVGKHHEYIRRKTKSERKKLLSLIGNKSYNHFIFDFFIHYSKIHPLDFYTFLEKYIFENLSNNNDFSILSLTEERIKTIMDGHMFLKRYIGYMFEWQTFFYEKNISVMTGKSKGVLIEDFQNNFKIFMDKSIYGNIFGNDIFLPSSAEILEKNTQILENLYNNLYISLYHQESTHEPLFMRTMAILDILRGNIKNIDILEKFIIILIGLVNYVSYGNKYVFNVNDFINNGLKNTNISRSDVMEFFNYIGIDTFENYSKRVNENEIDKYFPKNQSYNFINLELEIHKTPFIDISNDFGNEGWYFFDETFLLKKFYNIIGDFSIDDNKQDWDFGHMIEKYTYTYVDNWLLFSKSKLSRKDYVIKYSVEFGGSNQGEIDFLIYNKKTKNLIIFESKDHIQLNEKLFSVGLIENLTKKSIPNRKKPGNIYKGIEQLYKHSCRDKKVISSKIGDDIEIKKIEYVFLNHHNTMLWNEIVRYFVDKNIEFSGMKYHFMNLFEFEKLISIACNTGKDFYDLIIEKSKYYEKEKSYRLILEKFKSYEKHDEDFNPKYIETLNQDFTVFFYKNYNDIINDNYSFVNTDFITKYFINDTE